MDTESEKSPMKSSFKLIAMLLALAAVAAAQSNAPAKPLSPTEQTVLSAEKSFIEAAKKPDVALLKRMLADDFSYVGADGQLADRQERIGELGDGGQNIQAYDIKVVSLGDDAAIVTYDAVVRVPPAEDQGPPPRYQHFSSVWVKQGDTWKMKFQQTTPNHWGDWGT